MKNASDTVINNKQAIDFCKRLSGDNWMELYNTSWLAMREAELKGKVIDNDSDALRYFFTIARNKSRFRKTRIKKQIDIILSDDFITNYDYTTEDTVDKIDQIEDIIKTYLSKEPENMIDKFYQDFCKAILGFKSIKEAQEGMTICRTTFWILLNQLQEDLHNEI